MYSHAGAWEREDLKNRDFADISTLGIMEKPPFYRFSGRLTVQITFMFLP